MRQIALPLTLAGTRAQRIVVGNANARVVEALSDPARWPFRTAVLAGPPRSGKSLLAEWFAQDGGDVLDDAESLPEADLFHHWNRAQEHGKPLLVVANGSPGTWRIALPDLASRLGAALHLEIGTPDDAMMAELIEAHAEARGLVLDPAATAYLVPRVERSHLAAEQLVAAIDRLSLERKTAPTQSIWREALNEINGISGERA
jgi:chromosomal replication initiation ATPase DnaA